MLPQSIIALIGVLVVVGIAAYGFTTQGYFVHLTLLAAPIFIFLINSPANWFVLIVGLTQSKLVFPGLPQGLHVVHVFIAGFSALMLARVIILKPGGARFKPYEYFLIAFTLVIIVTAAVRGLGIRGLGGASWGGMAYIKLFITAAFLLAARQVTLKPKQIRWAIILMLLFSTLPLIAQLIFTFSDGSIYHQYAFVEAYVGGLISSLEASQSGGMVRYQMAGSVAGSIVLFALILIPARGLNKGLLAFFMLIAFVLIGFTGFRGQVLWLIGTLVLYTYFNSNLKFRRSRMVMIGMGTMAALLLCYPLIPYMPGAMQRALSWLPMAPIPWDIKYEASQSSSVRTVVWEMAWDEVPNYLLIGKGFTVNPGDLMAISVRTDWALNAFLSHNYHSGPLSLVLDTGLFGFIFGTAFMITAAFEMYRRQREIAGPPLMQRAYNYFLVQVLYSVPAYYLIFGDVRESFPIMFINLAVMIVIYNSSEKVRDQIPTATAPSSITTTPSARFVHGSRMARFSPGRT